MSGRTPIAGTTRAPEVGDLRRTPIWALGVMVIGVMVFAMLFVSAILNGDTALLSALSFAPVLIAITVPIALRIARSDNDPTLASIILAAAILKLVAAWIRHWVAFDYYGSNDSIGYHDAGKLLAPQYRSLDFTTDIGPLVGTGFIKIVTGVVYAIIGTTTISGFMVFSWLGFLGLLLMTRAFKIGVPQGDSRRYLIIVLFVPSLAYWPSAIGKEAWMILALGLCAYGVAAMFERRSQAIPALVIGLLAVGAVRPHVGLIIFIGLALAALLRRAPAHTYAAPFLRTVGVVALVVAGAAIIGQTSAFLEDKTSTGSLTDQRLDIQETTTDGGSAFSPVVVNTPIDMIPATITVFFRPFPFEAGSPPELATAAEGALLLLLLFTSRTRLRSIPRLIRTTPYVTFCIGYVLAFVFAFSSFANFGILARQRSQALPFLLVFLALPRFVDLVAESTARTTRTPTSAAVTPVAAPASTGPVRRRTATAPAATAGTTATAIEAHGRRRRRTSTSAPAATTLGIGASRRRARRPGDAKISRPSPPRATVSSGTTFPPPRKAARPESPTSE